jgi:hypothetical protein
MPMLTMATWRSGYATVCKTVYPGSIPGVASNPPVCTVDEVASRIIPLGTGTAGIDAD